MHEATSAEQVRSMVLEQFAAFDLEADREALEEIILLRDGHYRGRSYRLAGWMAMWMFEANLLMFYDEQGELRGTFELADPSPIALRRAA